jgi:hypothetical protein
MPNIFLYMSVVLINFEIIYLKKKRGDVLKKRKKCGKICEKFEIMGPF